MILTQVTQSSGRIRVEVRGAGFVEPLATFECVAGETGARAFIELGKLVIDGLFSSAAKRGAMRGGAEL
ncbi:MAG TPA: hypothetical protein VHC69_14380 [Polyangiaceae bacterium]|nr:hypothetical protein [Polyangiaceae bacterium]